MKNYELTPEKSLQIINDVLEKSRRDFEKDAGSPMVIWGVVVFCFSIVVWIMLTLTQNPLWNFLWFGIPLIGVPLSTLLLKGKGQGSGKSFISKTLGQIWISYGIFATVLSAVFAFMAPQFTGYITAVLLGFSAAMTGFILKNKFIITGGFITGLGCTVALFFSGNEIIPLFFALASIINLIIPGIMMNKRAY